MWLVKASRFSLHSIPLTRPPFDVPMPMVVLLVPHFQSYLLHRRIESKSFFACALLQHAISHFISSALSDRCPCKTFHSSPVDKSYSALPTKSDYIADRSDYANATYELLQSPRTILNQHRGAQRVRGCCCERGRVTEEDRCRYQLRWYQR